MKLFIPVFVSLFTFVSSARAETYRLADYPIFTAVYNGSAAEVEELIAKGADANLTVGQHTPLTYAVAWNKLEVVKTLLRRGADPNKSADGTPPLIGVVRHWGEQPNTESDEALRVEMAEALLQAGADPNLPPNGRSALTYAFQTRQTRIFETLKKAGAKFNSKGDEAPLIEAAKGGRTAEIDGLLRLGVGADEMDDGFGCTALCTAVGNNQADAVRVLLGAGALWPVRGTPSASRSTTWAELIAEAKPEIVGQFLDRGLSPDEAMPAAAERGEAGTIRLLLARGAEMNHRDDDGKTPLMIAALYGKTDNVKALLEAKADFGLMDKFGSTAKVLAASQGRTDCVEILAAAGADEYEGKDLPPSSPFAAELDGKDQFAISGGFHQALPFLPKNLRFFLAHEPIDLSSELPAAVPGMMYAVFPSKRVIKLDRVEAFRELKFLLRDTGDALKLAGAFSDPVILSGQGNVTIHFPEAAFSEFPTAGPCLSISPAPSTFGITVPAATEEMQNGKKTFRLVRYGRRFPEQSAIVRVHESISEDGSYSAVLTDIPTPGLEIRPTCFPR